MRFKTLLLDPPWPIGLMGKYHDHKHQRPDDLPYQTMTLEDIKALPIADLAAEQSHLWLWTTTAFLRQGFDVMEGYGFKYHNNITWIKPSGCGNYFISRTQVLLFGYRGKMEMRQRYKPNVLFANPGRHSTKPEVSYHLIEAVSFGPRIELFARHQRPYWTALGDGIDGLDIRESMRAVKE